MLDSTKALLNQVHKQSEADAERIFRDWIQKYGTQRGQLGSLLAALERLALVEDESTGTILKCLMRHWELFESRQAAEFHCSLVQCNLHRPKDHEDDDFRPAMGHYKNALKAAAAAPQKFLLLAHALEELRWLSLAAPAFAENKLTLLEMQPNLFGEMKPVALAFFSLVKASIARFRGDYNGALALYELADQKMLQLIRSDREFLQQRIPILECMAEIHYLRRNFVQAEAQYRKLIDLDTNLKRFDNLVEDYCDLANVLLEDPATLRTRRRLTEINQLLEAARAIAQMDVRRSEISDASILGMTAKVEMLAGNLDKALELMLQVRTRFRQAEAPMREGRALTYLGQIYARLNCPREALQAFRDAEQALREYRSGFEIRKVKPLSLITHISINRESERLSDRLASSLHGYRNLKEEAACRLFLGQHCQENGALTEAEDHFEKALEVSDFTHLLYERTLAQIGRARVLRLQGRFDEAMEQIISCQQNLQASGMTGWVELVAEAEAELAYCEADSGKRTEAIARLIRAIAMLEARQHEQQRQELHPGIRRVLVRLYSGLVRIRLAGSAAWEILAAMEAGRAISWLGPARRSAEATDVPALNSFLEKWTALRLNLHQEVGPILALYDLDDELVLARLEHDTTPGSVKITRRREHQKLRQVLADDGPQWDGNTVAYLKRLGVHLRRVLDLAQSEMPELVESLSTARRNAIAVVIPHREWRLFPFAACHELAGRPNSTLGVSFLHSLGLISDRKSWRRSDGPIHEKVVVLDSGHRLVMGDFERRSITKRFSEVVELVAAGQALTIEEIVREARDCSIFHVSSHAVFDPAFPLDSYIELGHGDASLRRWALKEILQDLRFERSPLVVLSLCEGGRSSHSEGEEHYGLASAFLQAGAKAVISSQWMTHEIPTALLVDHFYEAWRRVRETPNSISAARALFHSISAMRRMSWQEIEEYLEANRAAISLPEKESQTLADRVVELQRAYPQERPFDAFEFWAGYTCTGFIE